MADCKSQNTKNEQHCIKQNEKSFIQKDLSLTELWQKGELKDGYYYVRDMTYILPANLGQYDNQFYFSGNEVGYGYEENTELEVLAPVPSYEDWKAKLEENAQLKKQLNKTKSAIASALNFLACSDRISETECNEQLSFDVLRKALEELEK